VASGPATGLLPACGLPGQRRVLLSAWYIAGRNGPAVALLPGGSTRISMLGQAAVLAQHGYGAIWAGPRGHGRSGEHAMGFGWRGDRDIAAAVSLLEHQPGVQAGKIAALGLSMGGERLGGAAFIAAPSGTPR